MLLSVLFTSRVQEDDLLQNDLIDPEYNSEEEQDKEEVHLCTTDFYASCGIDSDGIETRATLTGSKKWAKGAVIRVKFLNDTSFLQSKVERICG